MSFHLHAQRSFCAAVPGVILAVALLGAAYKSPTATPERARVVGRVTCGGYPLGGTWIIFEGIGSGDTSACGRVEADGSFRMEPPVHEGLSPGAYRVWFLRRTADSTGRRIDARYEDARTSGLVVHVGPDWNKIEITLSGPDRGTILAQHRRVEHP